MMHFSKTGDHIQCVVLRLVVCLSLIVATGLLHANTPSSPKPNVVFVLIDDLGIEGFSCYGSKIATPNIDRLAAHGVRVTDCYAQPNCTPTRVKLMTGQRNYKTYDVFAHLDPKYKTIGNLMQDAGYKTCIAGKWQLNGSKKMSGYKPEDNHLNRAIVAGFDEYHLHNYTQPEHARYANSVVECNGKLQKGKYGPDMHRDFIFDFIKRNKKQPFFAYYPMVMVHAAYEKTPDSFDWEMSSKRARNVYLKEMIEYSDKIVGQLIELLKKEGVYENTVVIVAADNGTGRGGVIETVNGPVRGGKGTMTDAGTHVPLIIHYPKKIKEEMVWNGLIDFSDFYPTLADIAGIDVSTDEALDGRSFYPLVEGKAKEFKSREILFMQQDARRDDNPARIKFDNEHRNRFARTLDYKLYQTGEFYHVKSDREEQNALDVAKLSQHESMIYKKLKQYLNYIDLEFPWEKNWNP
ncbi:arylsulfatase A [Puteibacter caeruleilacunae]|nr:arylsulfatase A [Puteibacter caeruleilacunae]